MLSRINYILAYFSTPYVAKNDEPAIEGDDFIIHVVKHEDTGNTPTESYMASKLMVALEGCNTSDDVRFVMEESGLAL